MHLLIVHIGSVWGGAEKSTAGFLQMYKCKLITKITLASTTNLKPLFPVLYDQFVNINDYNIHGGFLNHEKLIADVSRFENILGLVSPDIVMGVMHYSSWVSALAVAKSRAQIKVVANFRGPIIEHLKQEKIESRNFVFEATKQCILLSDKVVVPSEGCKIELINHFHTNPNKIVVIHNAIDLKRKSFKLSSDLFNRLIEIKKQGPLLCTAGRLSQEKNHYLLIKAFQYIRKKNNAFLVIIGDGPERKALEGMASVYQLSKYLIFTGYLPNIQPILEISSLYIHTCNYEGFGHAILEAMACGLPVVATDCPYGPREIIGNNEFGRLVPVNKPLSLAEVVIQILEDVNLWLQLAELGRFRVRHFSINRMLLDYQKLYTNLLVENVADDFLSYRQNAGCNWLDKRNQELTHTLYQFDNYFNPLYGNLKSPYNLFSLFLYSTIKYIWGLHSGIFNNHEDSILQAQKNSDAIILSYLPSYCNSVAYIGVELGNTLRSIRDFYPNVSSAIFDQRLKFLVSSKFGNNTNIFETMDKIGEFACNHGLFQGVVVREALSKINLIDLFFTAQTMIEESGKLIFIDYFIEDSTDSNIFEYYTIDKLFTLADLFGFSIETSIDFSESAEKTLEIWVSWIEQHQSMILSMLSITDQGLVCILKNIKIKKQKLKSHEISYMLFSFFKGPNFQLVVSQSKEEDRESILSLFADSFGYPMPEVLWAWKYKNGNGLAIVVLRKDRIVAHFGGHKRKLVFKDKVIDALQMCDVMVASEYRGYIDSNAPYSLAAVTFSKLFVGLNNKYQIAFGFPNERHERLMNYLNITKKISHLYEIEWSIENLQYSCPLTSICINAFNFKKYRPILENLWKKMSRDFYGHMLGVRDADYINYRYIANPNTYEIRLVFNLYGGFTYGLVIFKKLEDNILILDLIGEKSEFDKLILYIKAHANSIGFNKIYLWLAKNSILVFDNDSTAKFKLLNIPVVCNRFSCLPDLKTDWWITGGDIDFL